MVVSERLADGGVVDQEDGQLDLGPVGHGGQDRLPEVVADRLLDHLVDGHQDRLGAHGESGVVDEHLQLIGRGSDRPPGADHVALALLDAGHRVGVLGEPDVEVASPIHDVAHLDPDGEQPLLDRQVLPGEDEIPVGAFRCNQKIEKLAAELLDRPALDVPRQPDKGGVHAPAEAAEQRLLEPHSDRGRVGGIRQ